MNLSHIKNKIIHDPENSMFLKKGWEPVYTAHTSAKILIIGQAPGRKAQETRIPWNDKSGDTLRMWLGITREEFYNKKNIALIPMDFYFPGSKKRGDLPPRKGFAEKWHPLLLQQMPNIQLILLIGNYSQKYYLNTLRKNNLTETVKNFENYLPKFIPLVHPSPRNNIWHKKNPWFQKEIVPKLHLLIRDILM